jgi:hypothetical protein
MLLMYCIISVVIQNHCKSLGANHGKARMSTYKESIHVTHHSVCYILKVLLHHLHTCTVIQHYNLVCVDHCLRFPHNHVD